jgi:ankyrin repeat protein
MGNYMTTMAVAEQAEDINLALIEASSEGNTGQVKMLLENGAEINKPSNNGNTALHLAGGRGHTETVVLLLENGAEINKPSNNGETALHLAGGRGHIEIVDLLVSSELEELIEKYQNDSKLLVARLRLAFSKGMVKDLRGGGDNPLYSLANDLFKQIGESVPWVGRVTSQPEPESAVIPM